MQREKPEMFTSPKATVSSYQSTTTPYQPKVIISSPFQSLMITAKAYKDYSTSSYQYTPKSTLNYTYQTPKPQPESQPSYTGKYQSQPRSDITSVTAKPLETSSYKAPETGASKPLEERKSVVDKVNQINSEIINKYKQYQSSPYTQYSSYAKAAKPSETTPSKGIIITYWAKS